jgi:hypothetical protein
LLGTTIDLTTSNIPTGTVLGLSILSLSPIAPPIDLSVLGMPTCELYLNLDELRQFATPGASAVVPYTIPAATSVAGTLVASQSALWTPGANAFGFLTSNAVFMTVGIN